VGVNGPHIRFARSEDVPAITAIIDSAFSIYTSRIGKNPGPMLDDHAALVARNVVYCLDVEGAVLGTMVLIRADDAIELDNFAVLPAAQGQGYGRKMMAFAERFTIQSGLQFLRLYTNEAMTENLAMYPAMGFAETHRALEFGFKRVFFEKRL
jgi:GNAT superfamily N-acetyltransferase